MKGNHALCNHLCSYKNINFSLLKRTEVSFLGSLSRSGVGIHSLNSGFGEKISLFLFPAFACRLRSLKCGCFCMTDKVAWILSLVAVMTFDHASAAGFLQGNGAIGHRKSVAAIGADEKCLGTPLCEKRRTCSFLRSSLLFRQSGRRKRVGNFSSFSCCAFISIISMRAWGLSPHAVAIPCDGIFLLPR